MANGQNLSASQQSTLGLYSAQARVASQRSADLFRLGKTAKVEELALELSLIHISEPTRPY